MEHGAGEVDDWLQARTPVLFEQVSTFSEEGAGVEGRRRSAQAIEACADGVQGERAAMPFDQPLAFGRSQQAVDRGRVECCSGWLVHGMG